MTECQRRARAKARKAAEAQDRQRSQSPLRHRRYDSYRPDSYARDEFYNHYNGHRGDYVSRRNDEHRQHVDYRQNDDHRRRDEYRRDDVDRGYSDDRRDSGYRRHDEYQRDDYGVQDDYRQHSDYYGSSHRGEDRRRNDFSRIDHQSQDVYRRNQQPAASDRQLKSIESRPALRQSTQEVQQKAPSSKSVAEWQITTGPRNTYAVTSKPGLVIEAKPGITSAEAPTESSTTAKEAKVFDFQPMRPLPIRPKPAI